MQLLQLAGDKTERSVSYGNTCRLDSHMPAYPPDTDTQMELFIQRNYSWFSFILGTGSSFEEDFLFTSQVVPLSGVYLPFFHYYF